MSNEEQAMSNLLPERVEDFRSLMRLEVLSEDRFKRSPLDSSQEEKWRVNLLPPDFPDEERPLLPARTVRQCLWMLAEIVSSPCPTGVRLRSSGIVEA